MPAHRHAVLLLEDHEDTREAIATLVSARGVQVITCATGADGLAHLRRDPGRWCLVLLDWWLPDMTGEDFLREQHADPRIANVGVTVMTADAQVRATASGFGVTGFYVKPVDVDGLLRLVLHHCDAPRATGTDVS